MLCEKCNKNEAKIHLIKLVNGEKTETWICEKCAKELTDLPSNISMPKEANETFQSILSGFFDILDKKEKVEIVCKNCGLTFSQFKKSGQLGCSKCYRSFNEQLKPRIKRIQGDIEHVGKVPVKHGNEVVQRKKIINLKKELNNAIIQEEYERAAVIRDEIKLLESSRGAEKENEKLDRE